MKSKLPLLVLLLAGVASASTFMIDKPLSESDLPTSLASNGELGKMNNRSAMDGRVKFKHYREFFNDGKVKINFYDVEFNAAVANEISSFLNR